MYIRVTRLTATADRNGTWEQEVGRQVERLIALPRAAARIPALHGRAPFRRHPRGHYLRMGYA
jgi:hypothetical protein